METKTTNTQNLIERLSTACSVLDWDHHSQSWRSNDGNWYSLSTAKIATLEQSLEFFIESCKIAFDVQWIIANNTLDILKNILLNPDLESNHNKVTQHVWQLIFNLVIGNNMNQSRIWKECSEVLLNYLQLNFRHKDTCRLIVFNIYGIGRLGQNEGTTILKILLKSFHQEMHVESLMNQGLHSFLEHFILDEKCITIMYLKLTTSEKLWMLKFTTSHIEQGDNNDFPISVDLLLRVCDEFKSKSERIFNAEIENDIDLQEVLAMFILIAVVSNKTYYELNRLDFQLLQQIGALLRNVLSNEETFENAFQIVCPNSDRRLKLLLLSTISNLVKGNTRNKEEARESGIIDSIVDFISTEGTNQSIYRSCVFTLIDVCYANAANQSYLNDLVKSRDSNKSEILRTLLIDIKYKSKK